MNKQDLNEVYGTIFGVSQGIIREGKECSPYLFVVRENGRVIPIPAIDAPSPSVMAVAQQTLVKLPDVFCVILLAEAYMASVSSDDHEGFDRAVEAAKEHGLKNLAGSKEVVVLNFLTKDDQALAVCKINRDGDKSDLERGELNWSSEDGSTIYGKFAREQNRTVH